MNICNLTISNSLPEFAKNAPKWFASLFTIKKSFYDLSALVEVNTPKATTYDNHFRARSIDDDLKFTQWIRSSFHPPREAGERINLPQHLYDSPLDYQEKQPNVNNACFILFFFLILIDE